jgi:hypothetical protein
VGEYFNAPSAGSWRQKEASYRDPVERRGQATGVGIERSTGNGKNRLVLAESGSLPSVATSPMNREVHVRSL